MYRIRLGRSFPPKRFARQHPGVAAGHANVQEVVLAERHQLTAGTSALPPFGDTIQAVGPASAPCCCDAAENREPGAARRVGGQH